MTNEQFTIFLAALMAIDDPMLSPGKAVLSAQDFEKRARLALVELRSNTTQISKADVEGIMEDEQN